MEQNEKGKKILLCEDEEFVARSYMRKLQFEGYTVLHAHNGKEGLELMRKEKPDLILLDLMMPLKNGFEVLKEMMADDELKNITVIVASNLGQRTDIDEATRLGAKDYIVKSNVSLRELVEKVKGYLPAQ